MFFWQNGISSRSHFYQRLHFRGCRLVDPLFDMFFFVIFCLFAIYGRKRRINLFQPQKMISTNEGSGEHLFAGRNTQQKGIRMRYGLRIKKTFFHNNKNCTFSLGQQKTWHPDYMQSVMPSYTFQPCSFPWPTASSQLKLILCT